MITDRSADGHFKSLTDPGYRLERHKGYEKAYETWLATLPEEERRKLKELDLDRPVSEQFGPVRKLGDEDEIEREISDDAPLFSAEDEGELETAIARALWWAVNGRTIVEVGQRWLAVMMIWRSPLIAGLALEFERELLEDAESNVGDDDDDGSSGRVLEWTRRGGSVSQVGNRVMAMAYVMIPRAIQAMSLQAIGNMTNKTRQAVDKIVQDFRDTFGGIRSRNMRHDKNRLICRMAQLGYPDDEELAAG